jgi:NAD(P)-dependent dehydrogenase (short-subunit alcohol dehydrogenase family)
MPVHLSLENRVALITGGSRGIGAATVRAFVEAGARVVFTYEKAREQAASLCRELGSERCVALACPTLEREKEFSTPSRLAELEHRRKRRADSFPLHSPCKLHYGGSFQRERRRNAGGVIG